MQPSTTRSACRCGKARWSDGAQSTSEALPGTLQEGTEGHQLAAAGRKAAIYTSSPASRVSVPATRMQSHPQKMQLRLHHNPARLAVFTHGHRRRDLQGFGHVLCSIFYLVPTARSSAALFHYVPSRVVNCASLVLLPTPFWRRQNRPGKYDSIMQLLERDKVERPFTIAASRCARRSIPDSRRIHHPPARYRPAT